MNTKNTRKRIKGENSGGGQSDVGGTLALDPRNPALKFGSVEYATVELISLHEDENNSRKHGDANMAAIENSLRRFGQVEPLVVQAKNRRVIGGNGRLAAMKKMGWTTATIALIDVDDATATALSIALNRTAELAEWDDDVLAGLLGSFDADLQGVTGFDDAEIQAIVKQGDFQPVDEDSVASLDEKTPKSCTCPKCGHEWTT